MSRYRLKTDEGSDDGASSGIRGTKVDVSKILRENDEKQRKAEILPELQKSRSRKKRDYIVVMILVNLALLSSNIIFSSNVVALVFSLAGVVIFSVGFTWIMWQVVEDY